jgi:hypothetical protein
MHCKLLLLARNKCLVAQKHAYTHPHLDEDAGLYDVASKDVVCLEECALKGHCQKGGLCWVDASKNQLQSMRRIGQELSAGAALNYMRNHLEHAPLTLAGIPSTSNSSGPAGVATV